MRKIQTRNAAIQTRRARTRDRGTQTEAEALPLRDQPPPAARRTVPLVLFLIAANLVLAAIAAIPCAYDNRWSKSGSERR